MSRFDWLDSHPHETPTSAGLRLLALNTMLALAFVAVLLLAPLPPAATVAGFAALSVVAWWLYGRRLIGLRAGGVATALLVGLAPVVAVTTAELAFLCVDPDGCVGAHILLLLLGAGALVAAGVVIGLAAMTRVLRAGRAT